nr:hypothetical protein CFP56_41995 [Quercus suber]
MNTFKETLTTSKLSKLHQLGLIHGLIFPILKDAKRKQVRIGARSHISLPLNFGGESFVEYVLLAWWSTKDADGCAVSKSLHEKCLAQVLNSSNEL